MAEILDQGKVWLRGKTGTEFAVKVDDRVIVPGQEEGQIIDYWLDQDCLCVDLHDPMKRTRIARRFPLALEGTHPATLFNGFTQTRHTDINVIYFEDEGVEEKVYRGEEYLQKNILEMSREEFWKRAGF
ncbi:MAG: hypothetical protein GWM98_07280 [Nitrospinaceae bacterium]|nr:hypothetical protein [Nitrospinaceae bacterium]NIR54338.1 hypothetical protein [Nitrospinaceae bacterium]NIS84756.1 hypothetical protein [Nitrospinaceae bacterium]NIT81557.1 hypothetical protein [Nitrospinaceae bacterium]NIU43842.1 hypothetical protein [Nitrospinaceae bacterium]